MTRKKTDKISNTKILLLALIVFFIGVSITTWFYAFYKVPMSKDFKIIVKIPNESNLGGFALDPYFHFGKVSPGLYNERELNLGNTYEFPVKVEITTKGNASQFIQLEDNDFILEPKESRSLKVVAHVPFNHSIANGTEFIYYEGLATIKYIRP